MSEIFIFTDLVLNRKMQAFFALRAEAFAVDRQPTIKQLLFNNGLDMSSD